MVAACLSVSYTHLTYDKSTRVDAVSESQKVTGIIREVTIGKTPVIKVDVNGELNIYEMSSDVVITFNGEPSDAYTAFRVGYTVEMTLDCLLYTSRCV